MTLRNFPPADQCDPEDLDAIADLVVSDPSASWDLAGSREHIEALCRRNQALVQERDGLELARENLAERVELFTSKMEERRAERDEATRVASTLQRDLDSARKAIADREDEIARINNERQAEVLEAAVQRERADAGEAAAEVFESTARAALAILARRSSSAPVSLAEITHAVGGRLGRALVRLTQHNARLSQQVESMAVLLDQQRQTRELDDQLRSTCRTITGKDLGEVNIQLDEELAANPDVGPLHHARDQRDHQEDTTP